MSAGKHIGISVVATVLALGSCEIAARAVFPAPPDPTRQPQIVYQTDADIRYVLQANQRGWIDDGFVTTNSLGFRGPEVALPKPAGRFRIVAIGDSVTFGWGVNDSETFCSQLEQLLARRFPGRDLDVVNLGVGGYDTRQEVVLLGRNVARLQPDLVLVGFYSNDVPEALDDKEGAAPHVSGAGEAGQVIHLNPAPTSLLDAEMRRSRAIYTLGRVVKRVGHKGEWGRSRFSLELSLLQGQESAELNTAWGRVQKQLDELRSMAVSGGFKVGVVVLPPREQVIGVYPDSPLQRKLRAIAEPLGFFVIDPLPTLAENKANANALFIPYDRNHPSAAGHRLLAQAISQQLDEKVGLGSMAARAGGNGAAR